jgi:hypothetical protein
MSTYPPAAPKVESKVKVSTLLAYIVGVGALAATNAIADTTLITDLNDTVEVFIAPLVPALATFIGGWLAKHTPRPDLPSTQR